MAFSFQMYIFDFDPFFGNLKHVRVSKNLLICGIINCEAIAGVAFLSLLSF
jgi:hypothetical protein